AIGRGGYSRNRQGITVHVGVIAQGRDTDRGILVCGGGIIIGNGRIIGAGNIQSHGDRVGSDLPIVGMVGEAVRAAVVWVGGVAEGAVAVEDERSAHGGGIHHGSQRIPVWVGVVRQHTRGGNVEGGVFNGIVAVVVSD